MWRFTFSIKINFNVSHWLSTTGVLGCGVGHVYLLYVSYHLVHCSGIIENWSCRLQVYIVVLGLLL